MADLASHKSALIARVVDGDGRAAPAARRAAFDHTTAAPAAVAALLDKVTNHAYKVTDGDVAAAVSATSEDEVFELVVCAAVGTATRQHDAVLALLEELP
jgi:hypothetical protein|nr:hypothetical protein [Kofleriaceae bacterium]